VNTVATVVLSVAVVAAAATQAQTPDPRLRELTYDARAVVTVPVKRGVVTHVILDADEAINDVASGLGGDCTKPEAAWCIAAQAGGRNIFVKPKSAASAPNNVAVVTDRRTHSFRFVVLADGDARQAVHRLAVRAPTQRSVAAAASRDLALPALPPVQPMRPAPSAAELVAERLKAKPQVLNSRYSIVEAQGSDDIVPTLVFDDGRFTYLRFPGNRELPAVFDVRGDGSESLVNSRMEDDLLVVDRVSRRLMLRAGSAVVGLWNEAFDIDGAPPVGATTVPGLRRALRGESAPNAKPQAQERPHE
jgi:type IV secretion system protein VirB9